MSIAALLPPKHGRYGRYKVCTNDLVIKMFVFSRLGHYNVCFLSGCLFHCYLFQRSQPSAKNKAFLDCHV